jgi:hypothetical protein
MVMATTSSPGILEEMQMQQSFNVVLQVPEITKPQQVKAGKLCSDSIVSPSAAHRAMPARFLAVCHFLMCCVFRQFSLA